MKTILSIALLMITTIAFAQETENQNSKSIGDIKNNKSINAEASYLKIGDIKGESTRQSSNSNSVIRTEPKKVRSGYMKIGDIKGESTARRRRVEILKSNKQGDPNKK